MSEQPAAPTQESTDIAAWAREVGAIGADLGVRVTERACSRSGWPPFEVVIEVEAPGNWHERVIHKRLQNVTRLDVVGAWRDGDACCGP